LKKKFKKGSILPIYEDWQTQKILIGHAVLTDKIKEGLPFILNDSYTVKEPEKTQFYDNIFYNWYDKEKVMPEYDLYSYERWNVFLMKASNSKYKVGETYQLNIRKHLGNIRDGELSSRMEKKEDYDKDTNNVLIDSFITVNGIEIY
jgi:hypothetical protein